MAFITAFAPEASADRPTPSAEHPVQFGDFVITETQSFPPARQPYCWAYITLNAEIALSLPRNPALQSLLPSSRARVSVDGQWIWWALRRKFPARPLAKLSGSELIYTLAADCARRGRRLLLVGSTPAANGLAVQRLRQQWPSLDVAGYAPVRYEIGTEAEDLFVEQARTAIRDFAPDYVVLGLGAAKEHALALRLAPPLDGVVSGVLCFGGAIDLASGLIRRAPRLWQQAGLEGLYRVLQRPRRAWRLLRVLRILPALARCRA
jgi:exopolysaccharide biosynthesis WecB/TagA/CpsF family protein